MNEVLDAIVLNQQKTESRTWFTYLILGRSIRLLIIGYLVESREMLAGLPGNFSSMNPEFTGDADALESQLR